MLLPLLLCLTGAAHALHSSFGEMGGARLEEPATTFSDDAEQPTGTVTGAVDDIDDVYLLAAKQGPPAMPPLPPSPLLPPFPLLPMGEALAEGAADNNGNLSLAEGTLLPEVRCLIYLAIGRGSSTALFEAQFRRLGFWDRVHVLQSTPDPDGKAAGCFRSHVRGWNYALSRGCDHTLMLEEDVYFNEAVAYQALDTANAFLAGGTPYDLYMLGWTPQMNFTRGLIMPFVDSGYMDGAVTQPVGVRESEQCVYNVHNWLCTQSYIISREAMERWRSWTYQPGVTQPIDVLMSAQDLPPGQTWPDTRVGGDTPSQYGDRQFMGRPAIGFQRYHTPVPNQKGTEQTGSVMETFKQMPGVVYSLYDPEIFGKAGITSPAACLPPAHAYTYTGIQHSIEQLSIFITPPFSHPGEPALQTMVNHLRHMPPLPPVAPSMPPPGATGQLAALDW